MENYTRCTLVGREVEFKLVPVTGMIAAGIDGRLIGNYESDAAAIVAALEHVRVTCNLAKRPLMPGRVREALRGMTATARHESRPAEGTGWYVYVGGEDAGGPFETEADALAHWQK